MSVNKINSDGSLSPMAGIPTNWIDGIQDNINKNGSKNLLPSVSLAYLKSINTWGTWDANGANIYTYNGITYTVNNDMSISISGTSTNNSSMKLYSNIGANIQSFNGCILNGLTNGSADKHLLRVVMHDSPWTNYARCYTGDATISTIPNDTTVIDVDTYIYNGQTIDTTLRPMIRLSTDVNDTYEPYAEPNRQLTEEVTGLTYSENKVGAVNYLRYNLNQLKALNTTGTWSNNVYTESGVSFTVNSDKTVTVTGQASATVNFRLTPTSSGNSCLHDTGWFRFLMSNKVGSDSTFLMIIYAFDANNTKIFDTIYADPRGADIKVNLVPDRLYFGIRIYQGYNANGYTFKPMITAAGDPNGNYEHYVPYRVNNKELTESFYDSPWQVTGNSLTWATGFSYNSGGYQKIGNLVFFALRATVTSTASTGDILVVSGLPKSFSSSNIFTFACHDSTGTSHVCFTQGNSGSIYVRNKPNGGSIVMTGFYFSGY